MNFATFAANIFHWILQTSWQAAVLVLVVLLAQLVFRHKLSPAWRYGLWLLVVIRLLMPASPQSAISIFNLAKFTPRQPVALLPVQATMHPPEAPVSDLSPPQPGDHSFHPSAARLEVQTAATSATMSLHPTPPLDWFRIARTIWLLGLGLLVLRLTWANLRFASRLTRYAPVRDPAILQLVDDCASTLRIRRPVIVIETEEVETPAVCGLWKKRLLLPDGIFTRFSSEELRHIFLHEMAHIRRRDIEVNWLASILQILHWFNPLLWLAFARMRADRELAADALALSHVAGTENVPYGETILKVVENLVRRSVQPGLVGIAESKAGLQERLRAIARCGTVRPQRWAGLGIVALVASIGLTSAQRNWTHEAWNMAFNISVTYKDPADRWSWVKRGINLDMEGLRSNPGETEICKDLSWIFRFKMCQNLDEAHMFYKLSWAEEMEEALDVQHGHPNFPALINPQTTNEVARANTLRETYQMDPAIMQELDTNFGPLDWRLPGAHALYWAEMGERNGNESKDKDILRRFNGQALAQVCFYQGALPPWVTKVTPQNFLLWPDLDMVTNVIAAYERANLADDAQKQTSRTAEKNFLRDAVVYLYEYNRDRESVYWFNYMKQNFTNALIGAEVNMNYDDYALNHVESSINDLDQTKGTTTVLALLSREYIQIIEGDDNAAEESSIKAHAVYNNYESRLPKGSQANIDRIKLAPFDKLARAEYGLMTNYLPPEAAARLRERAGIDVPTPAPRPTY